MNDYELKVVHTAIGVTELPDENHRTKRSDDKKLSILSVGRLIPIRSDQSRLINLLRHYALMLRVLNL